MTLAAMPWIADHGLPNSPESVFELREGFGLCALTDRTKEEDGSEVTLRRDLEDTPGFTFGAGEPFLDVTLDPDLLAASSLPSAAYMSSSTDISRRVLGRSVELLLDVDREELAGFMAWAHQAERVKLELHVSKDWGGRIQAWHAFTETCQVA
jgi:hypothetical protein